MAPVSGEVIALDAVPDEAFASKAVGDGVAIKPSDKRVVAPVAGTVVKIFNTNHAFCLESENGVEIVVHMGLDTVALDGQGFTRLVEDGAQVTAGQPVLEMDLDYLNAHARSMISPVVVSNIEDFAGLTLLAQGQVIAGETPLYEVKANSLYPQQKAGSDSCLFYFNRPTNGCFSATLCGSYPDITWYKPPILCVEDFEMSEAEARPTNFIRQIIDEDLASGKHSSVHTRFPPEPNGYLHIGHAKSICLNFGIAQDYQGECNLRFDDTNPVKEDMEFVESIKRDVQWLGFTWSGEVRYSSDYFDQLYHYAVELINKGLAYVDELTPDEIREYRGTLTAPGKNSPYRDRSVEENLALFEKMRNGEFAEGKACLRAKIDMASSFIVMRDPVLYRIKFAEHHQTGNKWCIYPMYDFTHCISDALEGITHSLCTLEFQDNRRLYDWVLDNITIPVHPRQYEFSRLNLGMR